MRTAHVCLPVVPFKWLCATVETAGDEAWRKHLKDACSPEESSDVPFSFFCCSSYERIDCRASCFLYHTHFQDRPLRKEMASVGKPRIVLQTIETRALLSSARLLVCYGEHAGLHQWKLHCSGRLYLFSRLPFPVSRNPLAKGLWSIFSCVI